VPRGGKRQLPEERKNVREQKSLRQTGLGPTKSGMLLKVKTKCEEGRESGDIVREGCYSEGEKGQGIQKGTGKLETCLWGGSTRFWGVTKKGEKLRRDSRSKRD